MQVWGIDPSSKCGLAIWNTDRQMSSVHCEVIQCKEDWNHYWYAAQVGMVIRERVEQFGRPDIVVIEQGSESTQGTGVNGVIWAWNCIGAVTSVLGVCGMPICTIYHESWRKPFYGRDFIPPKLPVMETVFLEGKKTSRQVIEKGRPKFKNDWKTAAIVKCQRDGIILPPQKTIAHNAAEAVGIAHSWAHSKIINPAFNDAFIQMKKLRGERTGSVDLFGAAA